MVDSMVAQWSAAMGDLISLSEAQIRRVEPYFLLSHGMPKVDDRRFISGVVFVIRNCRRWRNAPADYGPPKPIYNRFLRWSRMCVFYKIFAGLAAKDGRPDKLMINATRLRAHHTGASLLKKEVSPKVSVAPMPCCAPSGSPRPSYFGPINTL